MISDRSQREVSLSWFTNVLRKYTGFYVQVVFLAVCVRLFMLFEVFVFQTLVDRVLPFQRESSLIIVLLLFLLLGLSTIVFDMMSQVIALRAGSQAAYVFGAKVHKHFLDIPNAKQMENPVGGTVTRISETDTIRDFITGTATGSILDLAFLLLYVTLLFLLSAKMAIIVMILLPIQLAIYMMTGPVYRNRLSAAFDARARHQAQLIETIANAVSVKALGMEDGARARLATTLTDVLSTAYRAAMVQLLNTNLIFFSQRIITVALFYVGAREVFAGAMTLGELIAFLLISQTIAAPISNFSQLWESWQNIKVSRLRLGDILNAKTESEENLRPLPKTGVLPIVVDRVSYSYGGREPLLQGLSLRLEPNTITTLSGPSGAGKTTVGKLIGNLLRPTEGSISFGDYNYNTHCSKSMRKAIIYMPQEAALFADTLRNNITLGMEDVTDVRVWEALRLACIADFVSGLSEGLDTMVDDQGNNLSGGQKQRIALARAIIRDPKVLILDEPTSALDDDNQRAFVQNLLVLKERFTLLVITHNPDAIQGADGHIRLGEQ